MVLPETPDTQKFHKHAQEVHSWCQDAQTQLRAVLHVLEEAAEFTDSGANWGISSHEDALVLALGQALVESGRQEAWLFLYQRFAAEWGMGDGYEPGDEYRFLYGDDEAVWPPAAATSVAE